MPNYQQLEPGRMIKADGQKKNMSMTQNMHKCQCDKYVASDKLRGSSHIAQLN